MLLAEESLEGIEQIDDSEGYLGGFVLDLGMPQAEAILNMNLPAAERQRRIARVIFRLGCTIPIEEEIAQ